MIRAVLAFVSAVLVAVVILFAVAVAAPLLFPAIDALVRAADWTRDAIGIKAAPLHRTTQSTPANACKCSLGVCHCGLGADCRCVELPR
jgi:hypothetical protein